MNRQRETQKLSALAVAFTNARAVAGVCPIHGEGHPCGHCEKTFVRATKQRDWQRQKEQREAHAAWLQQGRA
jgi:hypothetical protein